MEYAATIDECRDFFHLLSLQSKIMDEAATRNIRRLFWRRA